MNRKTLIIIIALITLLGVNVVLAVLYIQKDVTLTGGVTVVGDIEVYGPDGISVLTDFDFPIFDGGDARGWLYSFFVNNTGNQQVTVYWNISSSSISWEKEASLEYYLHNEAAVEKYDFGVYNNLTTFEFLSPDTESIVLEKDEGVELTFMLGYTGEPVTAETFDLVASFYAYGA